MITSSGNIVRSKVWALAFALALALLLLITARLPTSAQTTGPDIPAGATATSPAPATDEQRAVDTDPQALRSRYPAMVKRTVLAVYDGNHEKQPHLTRIHRFAEMPLNHLGYVLEYRDVNTPLPGAAEVEKYRGMVTWFLEPLRRPEAVIEWLEMATGKGLQHVVLGDMAPPDPEGSFLALNGLYNRLGLQYTGNYVDVTYRAKASLIDHAMIGFERKMDKAIPDYPDIQALPNAGTIHLAITLPDRDGTLTSAVVATGKGGGFASNNFTIFYEPNTDRERWIINPFLFFKRALGGDPFPIPDVTTLSGRRIYFSHIDGDGWNNITELENYRQREMTSAEVVARELIEPFPDLPVSVALIAGDVDPALGGDPASAAIAKKLFALPQVEVASHTYTHPFNWDFFRVYDRKVEEAAINAFDRPAENVRERITRSLRGLADVGRPAEQNNRYIAGSDDLPRTYLKEPFDLDKEVAGAVEVTSGLAPAGKRVMIYQWSGDTTPFPAAIAATRKAGVRNINGGDSRLDSEYPSVAYVPAISRPAGSERQIYAVNSNENTYTNDWTGPYHGYRMLAHTIANTENPRRLKGVNVYYHMYSGEKAAALSAVRYHLDRARSAPYAPIEASHYAAIADSYFGVVIVEEGPSRWRLENLGSLRTVRFDDASHFEPDLAESTGVIGSTQHAGSLYVALDAAAQRAVVALRPAGSAPSDLPSLIESRWQLSNVVTRPCGVTYEARGYGAGEMVWKFPPNRKVRVVALNGSDALMGEPIASDSNGRLKFSIPGQGRATVAVRLECHE